MRSFRALALFLLIAFAACPAQALVFKSEIVPEVWDNWCFYHKDTYYLFYLVTQHLSGKGFGVATSKDGVHWQDHGWILRPSDKMVIYLGTGAVWKSADFAASGRFLCNYSEWRKEKGDPRPTQNILFAWSTDLLHWNKFGDGSMFKIDPRYYDKHGRWDCIYAVPRDEGGFWGTWTATARPGEPGGIVGIGRSDDGLHWTALPAPKVLPGVDESGAFCKFGKRVYAMFGQAGSMWSYSADRFTGPYKRAAKNARLLPPGQTYFSRFFPLPDGTVLVNHQSSSDWGWHVATLKEAVVDEEGVMRLKYWKGNEALKGGPADATLKGTANGTMMTAALDLLSGFVAEGTIRLAQDGPNPGCGFYLLADNGCGHAVRPSADGRAEFGTMDPRGDGWKVVLSTNRQQKLGATARFRLLVRRGMLELYLDDFLVDCYSLHGMGGSKTVRLGILDGGQGPSVSGLKVWQMSLSGKPPAKS